MGQLLHFPAEHVAARVDRAAMAAVHALARARLISEREAVAAMVDLGANPDEIELLRTAYIIHRGRL